MSVPSPAVSPKAPKTRTTVKTDDASSSYRRNRDEEMNQTAGFLHKASTNKTKECQKNIGLRIPKHIRIQGLTTMLTARSKKALAFIVMPLLMAFLTGTATASAGQDDHHCVEWRQCDPYHPTPDNCGGRCAVQGIKDTIVQAKAEAEQEELTKLQGHMRHKN
ncbi:hypothetical protein EJB05_37012, partial [Eragrostis curvula]